MDNQQLSIIQLSEVLSMPLFVVELPLMNKGYIAKCDNQFYIFLNSELNEADKNIVYESLVEQVKKDFPNVE